VIGQEGVASAVEAEQLEAAFPVRLLRARAAPPLRFAIGPNQGAWDWPAVEIDGRAVERTLGLEHEVDGGAGADSRLPGRTAAAGMRAHRVKSRADALEPISAASVGRRGDPVRLDVPRRAAQQQVDPRFDPGLVNDLCSGVADDAFDDPPPIEVHHQGSSHLDLLEGPPREALRVDPDLEGGARLEGRMEAAVRVRAHGRSRVGSRGDDRAIHDARILDGLAIGSLHGAFEEGNRSRLGRRLRSRPRCRPWRRLARRGRLGLRG
jgi:hypothetical protein